MFRVNQRSYNTMIKKLKQDIADEMIGEIKETLKKEKPYYEQSEMMDSFVYDETASLVGSESWAAAAVDNGKGWVWKRMPNFDKVLAWVQKYKSPNAPLWKQKQEAYLVARSIQKNGISPTFYIDRALGGIKGYEFVEF